MWNSDDWQALIDGSGCPICIAGGPKDVIADIGAAWVTAPAEAPLPGYACIVSKRHAAEPFELTSGEGHAFWDSAMQVARVLKRATSAVKVNYEIHGNTIPHLHMHIYPRFRGDPFESRPIDPRAVTATDGRPVNWPGSAGRLRRRFSAEADRCSRIAARLAGSRLPGSFDRSGRSRAYSRRVCARRPCRRPSRSRPVEGRDRAPRSGQPVAPPRQPAPA